MKKKSLLFVTLFLLMNVGYAQDAKRNPSPGELKPILENYSSPNLTDYRGDYFPMLYATSPDGAQRGVYKTTVGNPGNTDPALVLISFEYQSMALVGDEVYVIMYNPATYNNTFGKINSETGAFTLIKEYADNGFMAWNPVTNEMYISLWGGDYGSTFGKIDIETGAFSWVGTVPGVFMIAIDNDGICYGVNITSSGTSKFGTINLSNGNFEQISTYPEQLNYIQALSIDRGTNELYHAARIHGSSNPTPWRKINKSTGAITNLGTFPEGRMVEALCILNSTIPPDAPAAVSNLTATPNASGNLTAVLNWNNPNITAGGAPLTAITSVAVYENNGVSAIYTHPNPAPGSADTYSATVAAAGLYDYTVIATNTVGEGVPATATVWIGPDVPAAPGNVQLTASSMNITVTWTAPTTGLHGGYYSAAGLVYDIYRLPDNLKVASEQTGTTFSQTIILPGNYFYKVVAKNTVGEGGSALSNSLLLCPPVSTFPYQEGFENNGTNFPACWEHELLWHEVPWEVVSASTGTPGTAHSGNYKAQFNPGFWSGAKARLSTSQMNISALTNPALKFWHTQKAWSSDQDILKVYYKTSSGGTWILLAEYTTDIPDWTERVIALPNKSADYYIGFEGTCGFGNGIQLDDITILDFTGFVDAELIAITKPVAGTHINLTNNESVTVVIKNNGSDPITGFDIILEHNGNPIATESFPNTIPSLSQGTFTFGAKLDLSAPGEHIIKATVNIPNDAIPENNSKIITVTNVACSVITTFPFDEGFENTTFPPECWYVYRSNMNEATWERGTASWWGGAHSGDAFASHPFTYGAQESWLVTPPIAIPNSGNFVLEFWSYSLGVTWHEYNGIWVSTTGSNPMVSAFTEIKQLIGNEISEGWKKIEISLSNQYAGETIYIGFKYTGNNADSWMIDDVRINNFEGFIDAELVSITAPQAGTHQGLTNSEPVTVVIKNNGSSSITDFTVILELDGEVKATETYSGIIPSLEQVNYTFSATLNLATPGIYEIKVTVNLPNDAVPANNSKIITVKNVVCSTVTQFPFTEGFEDETFPPLCWTVYSPESNSYTWARNAEDPYYVHSGNASAYHRFGSGMQESWLITPPIAISNSGDFALEFWSLFRDPSYHYYAGIWVSTTDNNHESFTQIKELENESEEMWKKITTSLNSFAGETIYIAFKYAGDFADYWYIDDVSVTVTNVTCPAVTSFPFEEDFEGTAFPPQCWEVYKYGGDETWAKNNDPDFVHSGNASAGHTAMQPGFLDGWLVTPQITIPNTGNYVLEFWSYSRWPSYHEYAGVWLSTSSGNPAASTFIEIKELTGNEISDTWKKITISLSNNYAGENIYIAFRYTGNYADCWYVDDVIIANLSGFVDAELLAITAPQEGVNVNLNNNEVVTVVIKNNGSAPITGFEVILKLDDEIKATEIFTGVIQPIEQANFTFATTLDLSMVGLYEITVTVNLQGDEVPENNSKTSMVRNVNCSIINEFPYTEGFEDNIFPPACWELYSSGSTKTWVRTTTEKYNGEASAMHGMADGTPVNWLVTPPIEIPISGNFILEFFSYHLWNEFNVYNGVWASTIGGDPATSTYTEIKKLTGDDLTNGVWKKITIPVSDNYAGETVFFAFKYEGTTADYWYIDDILVYNFDGYIDGELTAIITPASGEGLTAIETVKVLIQNNGSAPLTGFNLILKLDDVVIATEPYSASIASLSQAEFTFNAKIDLSTLGTHAITVTLDVAEDQLPSNNSKTKKIANFSPEVVKLFGYRIYDNDFSSPPFGFISFDSNAPENVTRVNDYMPAPPADAMHAGEHVNGYFYAYTVAGYSSVNFVKISTTTWTDVSANPVTSNPIDMTYDFTTNVMYGIEMTEAGTFLVTINMETGAMTQVGSMGRDAFALACSNEGKLFAVDRDGNFCTINKTTASSNVIANVGFYPYYIQSMAFDHKTGRLFWAMCNNKDQGRLVEIDPATGVVFIRGPIAGEAEVIGLFLNIDEVGIIAANKLSENFKIYPNPVKDLLKIVRSTSDKAQIEIYNSLGAKLQSFEMSEAEMVINVSKWQPGVYFIRLVSNQAIFVQRFVRLE